MPQLGSPRKAPQHVLQSTKPMVAVLLRGGLSSMALQVAVPLVSMERNNVTQWQA